MAESPLQSVVSHLRRLTAADPAGDRDLLDRFVRQRDPAAFEAILHRHAGAAGPARVVNSLRGLGPE